MANDHRTSEQRGARKPESTGPFQPQAKPRPQSQPKRRRKRARRRRKRTIPKPVFVLSGITLVLALVGLALAVVRVVPATPTSANDDAEAEASAPKEVTLTFCAVGDNLINEGGEYTADLLGMADAWSGTVGDGTYDFSPLYAQLKPTISSYDVALINQETVLGGTDFEYQGFPSYNTPDELADAVADAGFDIVNCNTNHTYDLWTGPIEHAQATWAAHPEVKVIGSYTSQADRDDIRVVEKDGLGVAFLSYSYGQNGYDQDDLPNDYYAAPFDKDKMREEVTRAKELADAVVVYMHWGDENTHEVSDEQREYAAFLAGLGVDLVVGSHAHVIQPVEYVGRGIQTTTGEGVGAANGMLCVYGLGDFVSGYTLPKTILSGMFTCDFVKNETGETTIANPQWHALVEHKEGDEDAVWALADYTQEQAEANELLARVGEDETYSTSDPLAWAQQTTRDVIGDVIPIA